jgi:NAD(P)-dependent dehydrogenase (short-subunit alcohol dehydrogenase family)
MSARDEGRDRIALVTGGASGIGLATAGVLRQRNWRVVIADINAERSHAAAAQFGAEVAAFDVSDPDATEAAVADIESRIGPISALVANAGLIQSPLTPEQFPLADFDRIVAVNLRGVYISCVAAGRRMLARGSGGIVITGSVTASRTAPLHAYAPTKAAVVHMAACLAAEWGRSGVRVNAVSPGYTTTPALLAAIQSGQRDEALIREAAALGRMVEPDEIGRAVAFLLSDDAAAITGIDLTVDAGWLCASHLSTYGGVRPKRVL